MPSDGLSDLPILFAYCCCDKHRDEKEAGKEKVYSKPTGYSPSLRETKAGIQDRSSKQKPFPDSHSCLGDSTAHSGLGTSISNQENAS